MLSKRLFWRRAGGQQSARGAVTLYGAALSVAGAIFVVAVILGSYRALLERHVERVWADLQAAGEPALFDPEMVAELPAPAQRYLLRAIAPGTALAIAVSLEMQGQITLAPGTEARAFQARQLLATPRGLLWLARIGDGRSLWGYDFYAHDSGGMRWLLWGIVPMVHASGADITRSAAGRVALEAPLWLPSALLPQRGARWEAVDEQRVRVHLKIGTEALTPELTIAEDGRLERVEMRRWALDGVGGQPGYALWVGDSMTEEKTFDGYTIVTRVRATSHAGTPQASPFITAVVTRAEFH